MYGNKSQFHDSPGVNKNSLAANMLVVIIMTLLLCDSTEAFSTEASRVRLSRSSSSSSSSSSLHSFASRERYGGTDFYDIPRRPRPSMPRPAEPLAPPLERKQPMNTPFRSDAWRTAEGTMMDRRTPYNNGYLQTQPRPPHQQAPLPQPPLDSIQVQGGSRVRYDTSTAVRPYELMYNDPSLAAAHIVHLESDGRPVEAAIQVFHGPDHTPAKMRLYSDNGWTRPWRAGFVANKAHAAALNFNNRNPIVLDIQNKGGLEFPMYAAVATTPSETLLADNYHYGAPIAAIGGGTEIQGGGALKTFGLPVDARTIQVEIMSSHGSQSPVDAVVELWQGPNNVKQWAHVYADDGSSFTWQARFDLPRASDLQGGQGRAGSTTIAIRNKGPLTFPIQAVVREVPDEYDAAFGGGSGAAASYYDQPYYGRAW